MNKTFIKLQRQNVIFHKVFTMGLDFKSIVYFLVVAGSSLEKITV